MLEDVRWDRWRLEAGNAYKGFQWLERVRTGVPERDVLWARAEARSAADHEAEVAVVNSMQAALTEPLEDEHESPPA
jgi:hypothetical protein